MSNQLQTFAISDASTANLKMLWSTPEVDAAIFYPRLIGTTADYTQVFFRKLTPVSTPAFGQTCQYNIDAAGDWVCQMILELQLSAIVPSIAGSAVSYKNDITTIIDTVRLYQGGTLLQQMNYDQFLFQNRCFQTFEEYQNKSEAEGVLPLATRQARAAAGIQNFYIEIPSLLDTLATPLSILSSSVRVEISFKPMLNVIQFSAGTATASILQANLRPKFINCNPAVIQALLNASKTSSVLFPFMDFSNTRQDVAAGTTNIRFLLSEFKSLCAVMGFTLRESRQVDDTTGNPAFEISNSVGFTDWNMIDRSVNIVSNPDNLTPDYSKLVEQTYIFETYNDVAQRASIDWFFIPHSFAMHPWPATMELDVNEMVATGYYDFSRTESAYLILNNPTVNNQALRVNAYCYFMNVLVLRNGALSKYTL